ncbi:MAG: biopolymer transporter ExbD [Planctomycetaceae bacterium]|nr:biopolymer transporter ExbD [Planctomycetaceae bacterium]
MKMRRQNKMLIEPPSVATGDIAFNLLVFFLVCASSQPDRGRKQDIPRSDPQQQQTEQSQNIEVSLTRTTVAIDGNVLPLPDFQSKLTEMLAAKPRPEDKIVVVKSTPDTPYDYWIAITERIDLAGGIVTLQLEEEQTTTTN